MAKKTYVLDTSVCLTDADCVYNFSNNDIILPLKVLEEIINAQPTDRLWDDGRTDLNQLGLTYEEVEEAMSNPNSKNRSKYEEIRKINLHKMESIPVCKIPN